MELSGKFDEAMVYCNAVHAAQTRKKTGMPRIAHLLVVAGTVLEHGGSEEEAIAALLHDAVEDAGGSERLADIGRRFGDVVAGIVEGCSEKTGEKERPWRERKAAFVQQLASASSSVRLIAMADKLHNGRALLRKLREEGELAWAPYTGKKEGTIWYYRTFLEAMRGKEPSALIEELDEVVQAVERLAG